MSKMLATWLFAGLSLVAIGSVYVSIFNIPHQLIKFDEFLVLFQGSVFLCAGMWLLGLPGLNSEIDKCNSMGIGNGFKTGIKYFLWYFFVAAAIIGAAWLIITFFPQVMDNINKDYSRMATDISQGKNYLLDIVFQNPLRTGVYLLGACVLVPLEEELFFRRFFYVAIKEKFGVRYGIILSSLMFGVVHLSSPVLGVLIGVFLAFIYEKHKNLLINVITHGLINFFIILLKDVFLPYFN